jgi:hypothetical protein
MIDIREITSKDLREKKYTAEFPEYYALGKVIENNPWHSQQNVLNHVIKVFEGLEYVLTFKSLNQKTVQYLSKYLDEKIGNKSRGDILKIATLLHDIAKIDTLITDVDGTTRCPCHDLVASVKVHLFSQRFDMDRESSTYVERTVLYHQFISDILNFIVLTGEKKKYIEIFHETVGDVDIELILLMNADILGSDLKKLDRKAFEERMDILSWMLAERIPS